MYQPSESETLVNLRITIMQLVGIETLNLCNWTYSLSSRKIWEENIMIQTGTDRFRNIKDTVILREVLTIKTLD